MQGRPGRRWEAVPERDPKALLRARSIAVRAVAGFVLGGLFGTFMFPWYGPLTLRSVAAGLAASGTFGAVAGVIVPVAAVKAHASTLSTTAVHVLAAFSGVFAGSAWWLVATTNVSLLLCVVIGAIVGMTVIHG